MRLERALDTREHALLERLLTYGPRDTARNTAPVGAAEIVVVPRFGTISPWSSKATDIARVCGLEAVRRIERGITWSIVTPRALAPAELRELAVPLFDRD